MGSIVAGDRGKGVYCCWLLGSIMSGAIYCCLGGSTVATERSPMLLATRGSIAAGACILLGGGSIVDGEDLFLSGRATVARERSLISLPAGGPIAAGKIYCCWGSLIFVGWIYFC